MAMEIQQLRLFLALSRFRSFTVAAQAEHVSQPVLSQQIKRLETELGVRLISRNQRPLSLTTAGQRLLVRAEHVVSEVTQIYDETRVHQDFAPEIVTVTCPRFIEEAVWSVLAPVLSHHQITLNLLAMEPESAIPLLISGKADFGLYTSVFEEPLLQYQPMLTDHYVAVVAKHHPLAKTSAVSLEQLREYVLALLTSRSGYFPGFDEHLLAAGVQLRVAVTSRDPVIVKRAVEQGTRVGVLPQLSILPRAADRFVTLPVVAVPEIPVGIVQNHVARASAATQILINRMMNALPRLISQSERHHSMEDDDHSMAREEIEL